MITVSDDFKRIANSNSRILNVKVEIDSTMYQSQIMSMNIQGSISDEDIVIGSTPCMRLSLELSGLNYLRNKAVIKPFIQFEDNEGTTTEWVQLGVFYNNNSPVEDGIMQIAAYDKMLDTETLYESKLDYPASGQAVLEEIGKQLDFTVDITADENIQIFYKPTGYTYREIIGYMASLHGANALFNNEGRLIFNYFYNREELTLDVQTSQKKNNNAFLLKKLTCVKDDVTTYTQGNADTYNTLAFQNPFMDETQFKKIASKLIGLKCNQAKIVRNGCGYFQLGEMTTTPDIDNVNTTFNLLISGIELNFDGGDFEEIISSSVRTEADAEYVKASDLQQAVESQTKELQDVLYAFENESVKTISNMQIELIRINFTCSTSCTPTFQAYMNFECRTAGLVEMQILIDDLEYRVAPKVTMTEGWHIVNLYLPFEFEGNTAHTLIVTAISNDGADATANRYQIQASIKGQGLTAVAAKWDGIISTVVEIPPVEFTFDDYNIETKPITVEGTSSTQTPATRGLSVKVHNVMAFSDFNIDITDMTAQVQTEEKEE